MRPLLLRFSRGRDPYIGTDAGSATAWVLVATAVLLLSTVTVLAFVSVVVTRHRAAAVADLAALSAVPNALSGAGGCATARRVAAASGGALDACAVTSEGNVEVAVSIPAPSWLSQLTRTQMGPARARARAGPTSGCANDLSGRCASSARAP
jgi:secretion/DNA translocation related TadE-like protein